MRQLRKKLHTLLIGTILLQPLLLQAEADNRDNAPVWYQFEVLIFERIAPGAGSTEGWPNDPGRPLSSDATWFTKGQPLKGNKPIAFRALPAEEKSLSGAWGQMRRSRDYRPLYHVAWRQPVKSPDQAKQVFFTLLPANGAQATDFNLPKLEGSLKFSVKRYLHLNADIALHKLASGSDPQASGDNYGFAPRYKHYRLQESRRMRSGKLYYIDHPVLGILVNAERYEPPQPEPVETPIPVPTIIPPTQSQGQVKPSPATQ
ncbi:CsiV family protein [Candidatus Thiodiazotropha sp. CDECU1]|uniref:CsiV family protein n=1 Tax=Candidatus Thiodiazotropha sp. CDECU1 TaxID=3065865 RepID=UPI00292E78E0|nr:CsiV family protein [Candidatus Thiodiazotropha sp. CDECU1]